MEGINKKIMFISFVLACFTALFIYIYLKQETSKTGVQEKLVNVIVAAKNLDVKQKISEADIKEIKVKADLKNSRAIQNKADIIGRRVKDKILEGEQILPERLVDDSQLILAYNIPEGKRAMSVNVNDQICVSGMIRPGDFVDVIVSFDKEEMDINGEKITFPKSSQTILQNIQVLALGQEQVVKEDKVKDAVKVVTLAVTPEEAEKLTFSSEYGTLRFALRAQGDDKVSNLKSTTRSDISIKR